MRSTRQSNLASRPAAARSAAAAIETLESRRLLSTAALASSFGEGATPASVSIEGQNLVIYLEGGGSLTRTGTLVVKGTAEGESIAVTRDGDFVRVQRRFGSNVFGTSQHAGKVKRILVEAGGGDDRVHIARDVLERVTVVGGAGDDRIDGNNGSTLIGGGGNDRLFVPDFVSFTVDAADPESPAAVEAGLATRISMSAGPSFLSGGDGDDVLIARAADHLTGGRGNDMAYQHIAYLQGTAAPAAPSPEQARANFGERAVGIESFGGIGEAVAGVTELITKYYTTG